MPGSCPARPSVGSPATVTTVVREKEESMRTAVVPRPVTLDRRGVNRDPGRRERNPGSSALPGECVPGLRPGLARRIRGKPRGGAQRPGRALRRVRRDGVGERSARLGGECPGGRINRHSSCRRSVPTRAVSLTPLLWAGYLHVGPRPGGNPFAGHVRSRLPIRSQIRTLDRVTIAPSEVGKCLTCCSLGGAEGI